MSQPEDEIVVGREPTEFEANAYANAGRPAEGIWLVPAEEELVSEAPFQLRRRRAPTEQFVNLCKKLGIDIADVFHPNEENLHEPGRTTSSDEA